MFAVPGWNVAAKTLVPESAKPVKVKAKRVSGESQSAEANGEPGSRKRKRNRNSSIPGSSSTSTPKRTMQQRGSSDHEHPRGSAASATSNSKQLKQSRNNRSKQDKPTGANTEPVIPRGSRGNISRASHVVADVPVEEDADSGSNRPTSTKNRSHTAIKQNDVDTKLGHILPPIPPASSHLTPLQAKMRAKLTAARFRHLNETLYTTSSTDALDLFTKSPDLFNEYHSGFSQQVKDSWPENPVLIYLQSLQTRGRASSSVLGVAPLPRRKPGTCTIADLGCGDAHLARGLQNVMKKLNLKLHSFDLHAANDMVTVADISRLPLQDGEADIAIFCLSLMGTNWLTFVEEAWRILRGDGKGEVWVAEVKSRFGRISAKKGPGHVVDNSVGKRRKTQNNKRELAEDDRDDESALLEVSAISTSISDDDTDLDPFIQSFNRRGFMLKQGSVDKSNKMFVSMIFVKSGIPQLGKWRGMKWNGKEYQKQSDRRSGPSRGFSNGRAVIDSEDEVDDKEEGKLLKPCVYKLR